MVQRNAGVRPDAPRVWRPERGTRGTRHSSQATPTESNRYSSRRESTSGWAACRRARGCRANARPGQQRAVHVVGTMAEPQATQYWLANRLPARQPPPRGDRHSLGVDARIRDERSRARRDNIRLTTDHSMSLRLRLILAFFLLSVVPLGALTFYVYRNNAQAMRETAGRETELLAGELSQRMQVVTARLTEQVEHLVELAESNQAATDAARRAVQTMSATPVQTAAATVAADDAVAGTLGQLAMLLNNVELR